MESGIGLFRGLAGAGCMGSTLEGALDLTPAPSDSSSALIPSPEERRRTTGSYECVIADLLGVSFLSGGSLNVGWQRWRRAQDLDVGLLGVNLL